MVGTVVPVTQNTEVGGSPEVESSKLSSVVCAPAMRQALWGAEEMVCVCVGGVSLVLPSHPAKPN